MVKRLHKKKCDKYTKDESTYTGGFPGNGPRPARSGANKDVAKQRNKLLHPEKKDISNE